MVTSDLLTSNGPTDLGVLGQLRATGQMQNVSLIHRTIVLGCDAELVPGVNNDHCADGLAHIEVMIGGLAGQEVILHAGGDWQCQGGYCHGGEVSQRGHFGVHKVMLH